MALRPEIGKAGERADLRMGQEDQAFLLDLIS